MLAGKKLKDRTKCLASAAFDKTLNIQAMHSTAPHAVRSKVDVPELVLRRRAQFIDAAIALFGQRGYHVTTIREIALAADVSIGLIYQYVEDKEDILFLALIEVLDSYKKQIPKSLVGVTHPVARFCTAVRAYCEVNDRNVNATVLAYRETKSLRKSRRKLIQQREIETNALIADCIDECISGALFNKIDVELMTYQVVMFCHAWALKSWRFRKMMTLDEYIERGLTLMLGSVLTARGRRAFARMATPKVSSPVKLLAKRSNGTRKK